MRDHAVNMYSGSKVKLWM